MVYAPQRRHVTSSLAMTIHAVALLQHLYHPNVIVFLSRSLVQIQINAPATVHPQRSLLSLAFVTTLMSLAAAMLHVLDFVAGVQDGKSLVLDFIGQTKQASMIRILLLDVLLFVMQMSGLIVAFITGHGANLSKQVALPFDDLLLPPERSLISSARVGQDTGDIEQGQNLRRRRKDKNSVYDHLAADDEEGDGDDAVWLDDSEDAELLPSEEGHRRRMRDPPYIFSLSFPHAINLVLNVPSPSNQSGSLLGATPQTSPRPGSSELTTSTTEQTVSSTEPTTGSSWPTTATATDESAVPEGEEDHGSQDRVASGRRLRGAASLLPEADQMPGGYWTARRGQG